MQKTVVEAYLMLEVKKTLPLRSNVVVRYIQCPKCGKKYLTTIYTYGMFEKFKNKKEVLLEQQQLIFKLKPFLQQYNIQYYHILANIGDQLDEIKEKEESVNGIKEEE
jgi:hypothetical protein